MQGICLKLLHNTLCWKVFWEIVSQFYKQWLCDVIKYNSFTKTCQLHLSIIPFIKCFIIPTFLTYLRCFCNYVEIVQFPLILYIMLNTIVEYKTLIIICKVIIIGKLIKCINFKSIGMELKMTALMTGKTFTLSSWTRHFDQQIYSKVIDVCHKSREANNWTTISA